MAEAQIAPLFYPSEQEEEEAFLLFFGCLATTEEEEREFNHRENGGGGGGRGVSEISLFFFSEVSRLEVELNWLEEGDLEALPLWRRVMMQWRRRIN